MKTTDPVIVKAFAFNIMHLPVDTNSPYTILMVTKYYGFLTDDEWMLQQGLRRKLGTDKTLSQRMDTMSKAIWDIVERTGITFFTKYVTINVKGKHFWCLALSSTDPRDGMGRPHPEHVEKLKAALMKLPRHQRKLKYDHEDRPTCNARGVAPSRNNMHCHGTQCTPRTCSLRATSQTG